MADAQRVLGGRYLLKDRVGNGGMATVYRAQDQVLNRTVAVKIMLPQYAGDPTFAARFKQEAQAAAGLSSPYIVGVYDWGKDGDTYFIVMEYLRGTDLKSGIRSHGALDPQKVAQIGAQICGALSVAHKHEIIHRDIKPQNIMVLPDGNIKVMDFGIARGKNSHLTQDNNVLGTAHYVSPEQTRGQDLGPTSDIYSLGVVMYECATGKVPFDGDDAISVALKQVNELPVPPSQLNPRVDATLERIILRCMEKDAANRFQTADELRQALIAYATGQPVDVAEPTRVIGVMGGAVGTGATQTRVMNDSTQVMARPAGTMGNTAARPGVPVNTPSSRSFEYEEPKKNTGKIVAIVAGVIAVVALAFFAATSLFGNKGEQVLVPNVVNEEKQDAQAILEEAGFVVEFDDEAFDETVPAGCVADQTPDGNKTAEKGSMVTLVVSKGPKAPEQVEVPNLTGKSEEEALKLLEKAKLQSKKVGEEERDDVEPGQVFWQGTNTGTQVDEGTEIEYKVAIAPEEVSVPGVLGDSKDSAANTLSNAGFKVDFAEDYSSSYPKGTVMAQSQTGMAKQGTTITITISLGTKEPEKINVPNYVNANASYARAELENMGFKVILNGPDNGMVTDQSAYGNVAKGSTITLTSSDVAEQSE